jgi:hypothetical protein
LPGKAAAIRGWCDKSIAERRRTLLQILADSLMVATRLDSAAPRHERRPAAGRRGWLAWFRLV